MELQSGMPRTAAAARPTSPCARIESLLREELGSPVYLPASTPAAMREQMSSPVYQSATPAAALVTNASSPKYEAARSGEAFVTTVASPQYQPAAAVAPSAPTLVSAITSPMYEPASATPPATPALVTTATTPVQQAAAGAAALEQTPVLPSPGPPQLTSVIAVVGGCDDSEVGQSLNSSMFCLDTRYTLTRYLRLLLSHSLSLVLVAVMNPKEFKTKISYAHSLILSITCTCCYDEIQGTQDLKIYYHAASLILSHSILALVDFDQLLAIFGVCSGCRSDSWSEVKAGSLLIPRKSAGAAAMDGCWYVAGGAVADGSRLGTMEVTVCLT